MQLSVWVNDELVLVLLFGLPNSITHPDLRVLGDVLLDLQQQAVAKAPEQCRATGEYNVLIQHLTQVHVGLLNGVHEHLVDSLALLAQQVRSEKDFRGSEAGRANLKVSKQSSFIPSEHPFVPI